MHSSISALFTLCGATVVFRLALRAALFVTSLTNHRDWFLSVKPASRFDVEVWPGLVQFDVNGLVIIAKVAFMVLLRTINQCMNIEYYCRIHM